jgi:anti-anti-sigma factor
MKTAEFQVLEDRLPDGTSRLVLRGELDMVGGPEVIARLAELERSGRPVRLDLSGLTFMDSTGVGILYQASKRSRAGGPSLEIVRPTGEPWRALEVTGLHRVLTFVEGDEG